MKRRDFLLATGSTVVGLGCGALEGEPMSDTVRNPPWLMWGNSQTITHIHVPNAKPIQTTQLIRISYGRPESWRWLFSATIIESESNAGNLIVTWQPTIGIGRGSVTLAAFDSFTFLFPLVVVPTQIFAANVIGPPRTTGLVPPNQSSIFDVLVAQDIQLQCKISFAGLDAGSKTTLVLDAHFAPNVHIRPGWFKGQDT